METIKLTMSQALVKFLTAQYINFDGEETKFVEGVMGIFGHGNVVGIGQALEQFKDEMTFIQGKNEQDIAHACIGYAKQQNRRKIFACTASIGPGSLNMVTAAGTATVNKIPVLLLPSDTYADRQPDPVLQQLENEEDYSISVNDSFKAVSKYWDRIVRPEQIMTALINAFRVLTDPAQTGAVTLCLPQDVQGESYEYPVEFFAKRVWYVDRIVPSTNAVKRAIEVIEKSKKPLIIAGGGVRYSQCAEVLERFCEEFQIPFAETQAGKGEIPYDSPYNLGCVGVCGTLCANLAAKEADLIIAVGTKLNDFVTSSKSAFASEDVQLVCINVSRRDSLKMDGLSLVADAGEGLMALSVALKEKNYKSGYLEELKQYKELWKKERDKLGEIELPQGLSQARVLMELNNLLGEKDIIVSASGSMPSDLERIWQPKNPGTYHLEYGFSCMGYEIPAAMGAKIARPDCEVYALLGDGVFSMAHSEFITSLQERKKINVVLFDNNGHQCIHNLQRSQGIPSFGTEFRYREGKTLKGDYLSIDFAAIAEGYGAKAYRVSTLEELREAISDSKQQESSTLIDIKVLPGTMTEGYESFWRVGTASVAEECAVEEAAKRISDKVKTLRKY